MNPEALMSERLRLSSRPSEEPTRLLGLIVATPLSNEIEYSARIREILLGAIDVALTIDFDSDELPTTRLPKWFLDLTDGTDSGVETDATGSTGKERYLASKTTRRSWDVEEWLYCFDPDLRSWSWWDITHDHDGRVRIWVDTAGEDAVALEELSWAVSVSGADIVEPFTLEEAIVWEVQPSIVSR